MNYKIFVLLVLSASSLLAEQTVAQKTLSGPGAIRGGQIGDYVSLIDLSKIPTSSFPVTNANATNKAVDKAVHKITHNGRLAQEKILFKFGGQTFSRINQLGYYQIEYRAKTNQLIFNFSRALQSKIRQSEIQKKLHDSQFIQKVSMDFDISGQSTLITFDLKKKIKIQTQEISGDSAQKSTAALLLEISEENMGIKEKVKK